MDPLTILQLALKYGPLVKSIIDASQSNGDIVSKLKQLSAPLASILEEIGMRFFPQAQPALHAAAGAMAAFDPDVTKWLQGSLNVLLEPSPNLTVDGIYGARTKAAVQAIQAKAGLTVDGWAGRMTQAAIETALSRQNAIAGG